eukprot:1357832-Pyramimonas_sp.AAC.1
MECALRDWPTGDYFLNSSIDSTRLLGRPYVIICKTACVHVRHADSDTDDILFYRLLPFVFLVVKVPSRRLRFVWWQLHDARRTELALLRFSEPIGAARETMRSGWTQHYINVTFLCSVGSRAHNHTHTTTRNTRCCRFCQRFKLNLVDSGSPATVPDVSIPIFEKLNAREVVTIHTRTVYLVRVAAFLQNVNLGDYVVEGEIQAYSCKPRSHVGTSSTEESHCSRSLLRLHVIATAQVSVDSAPFRVGLAVRYGTWCSGAEKLAEPHPYPQRSPRTPLSC